MGVKRLWQLIKSTSQPRQPKNEKLAIDTSIWLHYYKNIPQNLFVYYTTKRIIKLLLDKNKPIFVFDGKTPLLKQKTIAERQKINIETAARKYIKNETCKICDTSVRICKHFAVEKNEIVNANDKSAIKNVKKNKPKIWGMKKKEYDKYHNDQEIAEDMKSDNMFNSLDGMKSEKSSNKVCHKTFSAKISDNKKSPITTNTKKQLENNTKKNSKDRNATKRYLNDEIEFLENDEFKNLSQAKKLKILIELREKRKMPTKIVSDSGIAFSVEQLNNLRKRNKISTMIRTLESKNKKIQSDCKTIYHFEESTKKEEIQTNDDANIESIFSSDENELSNINTQMEETHANKKNTDNDYSTIEDVFKDDYKECVYENIISKDKIDEFVHFDINDESYDDFTTTSEESAFNKFDIINEQSTSEVSAISKFDIINEQSTSEVSAINKYDIINEQSTSEKSAFNKFDIINEQSTSDKEQKNDEKQDTELLSEDDEAKDSDIKLKCKEDINLQSQIIQKCVKTENLKTLVEKKDEITDISEKTQKNEFSSFANNNLIEKVKQTSTKNIEENIHYNLQIPKISINNDYASDVDILQSKIKDILKAFDLPYIDAPLEADSQCAYLSQKGLVNGIITEDNDVFLYGCNKVYKNYYKKNKAVEEYNICDISKIITRDEMILLSYYVGSDYTTGIKGIGIKNAYKKVKDTDNDKKDADFLFKLYYGTLYKEIEEIEWKIIDKNKITKYITSVGMTKEQIKEIKYYLDRIET